MSKRRASHRQKCSTLKAQARILSMHARAGTAFAHFDTHAD
eukprot:CAMPEP_0204600086 /NCGR_PEP_ID=MMETSP0661-20131031/55236_1 /ASSEMBLY_ACC=CAM_ASM_000606 /TAXON_ID=109239 /ORGANISM="Alexandrium margalefi, Strain AMGDE01CS-322" /LENGTH=40 /DNA_ID= /DNA_START= /DNA_END= /DNA_ORIENTATION=